MSEKNKCEQAGVFPARIREDKSKLNFDYRIEVCIDKLL